MASSSDDDAPLMRNKTNGVKSATHISKAVDAAMDKGTKPNGRLNPGISIRAGPVDEMDVDRPHTNGISSSKRKSRPSTNGKSYREESSDDDVPLTKRRKTSMAKRDDSDSDVPLSGRQSSKFVRPPKVTAAMVGERENLKVPIEKKLVKEKMRIEAAAEKTAKSIRADESHSDKKKKAKRVIDSDDEDVPLAKKKALAKKSNGVKAESSDDDVPLTKKRPAEAKVKDKGKAKAQSTPVKKPKSKVVKEETEEPEDDGEESRWWENIDKNDDSIKWKTLEHNGVIFPPPYEPLPKNVKLVYDGMPVTLPRDAEEIAGFYGAMLNSEVNVTNPTFNKNFFADFKAMLDKVGHGKDRDGKTVKITSFEKCDFKRIFEYYDAEREKKKAATKEEKKAIKEAKDAAEEPYLYCMWDGRKQKVGNFRIEPPGLFRGRGEHPKTGKVKQRVQPEQVTINIGKSAKVPTPPAGHRWKEIKHDQTGTWLATWQENINGNYKYVMLAATSDVKGQSDYNKFEKARGLKKYIDKIRKDYTKDLKAGAMADRQRATAVYLIDKLALRAGNEKGEDEADTVGCCSLKFEHVTLRPPTTVIFDFLGKDSIPYYDEVEVDQQVFKNLKIFKKAPKTEGDQIFDRLTTSALNKHLSSYMPGLTAKVFRTYNASWVMSELLKEMSLGGTVNDKFMAYQDANRKVAILCNHKRTVGKGHAGAMEKLNEKINGLRYQQWRLKMMMLDVEPKLKKKKGADYFERDEDLDDDWMKQHQEAEVEEKRTKIKKKFEKDNEKLRADGEKEMKVKELEERLEEADDLAKKYKKENKTGKVEAEGKSPTVEKLESALEKLQQRVATMKMQSEDKENNKEIALTTSKTNYIDPRLSVVFSKKFGVPMEKLFPKSLREKFEWAIKSVDETWEF